MVLIHLYSDIKVSVGQFVFKTEPHSSSTTRTVHEELAKAMTAILKPSTDFLTSNKLLKVHFFKKHCNVVSMVFSDESSFVLQYSWYFFEALVKSMAQYLIESCKVKVSLLQHVLDSEASAPLQLKLYNRQLQESRAAPGTLLVHRQPHIVVRSKWGN